MNTLADCPPLEGATTHDELVAGTEEPAQLSAVAMDQCGRFIVAWQWPTSDCGVPDLRAPIQVSTYEAVGTPISTAILLSGYQDGFSSSGRQCHSWPSIAITPSGQVLVVSTSDCETCGPEVGGRRLISTQFAFDSIPPQSLKIDVPADSTSYGAMTFSAGIGDYLHRAGWSAAGDDQHGLFIGPDDLTPLQVQAHSLCAYQRTGSAPMGARPL